MIGCKVEELETSCLLVNIKKMEHNHKLMQQNANHCGLKPRLRLKIQDRGAISMKQLEYGVYGEKYV